MLGRGSRLKVRLEICSIISFAVWTVWLDFEYDLKLEFRPRKPHVRKSQAKQKAVQSPGTDPTWTFARANLRNITTTALSPSGSDHLNNRV